MELGSSQVNDGTAFSSKIDYSMIVDSYFTLFFTSGLVIPDDG